MTKKLVNVVDCTVQNILAQDIYNEVGTLLISENTKINNYIIDKILSLGYSEIYIYEQEPEDLPKSISKNFENLVEKYETNVDSIKNMIENLANGGKVDFVKIENMANDLYKEVENKNGLIQCLSTIKNYDNYTYNHSVNVSLYGMLIAKWLKLSERHIKGIIQAGLLHDIGKSQIPLDIINKKGKLTEEEFALIKKHPVYGYNLAKDIPEISKDALFGILMHHERIDGSGYPMGSVEDKIGIYGKIIAIADVYDALTSERAYKNRINPFETIELIERTGLGKFDTKILLTFLQNVASYYIGCDVYLNTGEQGKVVWIVPNAISRPIISVGDKYISLAKERELEIVEFVN